MTDKAKKNVLVVGGGSVGAIAALNLEMGGLATVTLVLRSNYEAVNTNGYHIKSCDHGVLEGWKPTSVRNSVPDIEKEGLPPYDYVVLTTKNIPDIPPLVTELVAPALPKNNTSTTLVLLQNGLNIEKPFLTTNPTTPVLSGVSLIGSAEPKPGFIDHDEPDRLLIGPYANPNISASTVSPSAEQFATLYANAGKTQCTYSPNVMHDRWRKLVYNACLNPICAITGLDTGRIRLADSGIEGLVRPAMKEIIAAARKAAGVELGDDVADYMINVDPLEGYLAPSMLADVRKGNFIEYENLLGEPLREGKKAGVPMPTLEVLYNIARAIQWRTKEQRGLVEVPKPRASI